LKLTLGAAHYRAGHAAKALEYLEPLAGRGQARANIEAEPLLALVHFRLGNVQEARARAEKTRQRLHALLMHMKFNPMDYKYENVGEDDLLKLIVLYREIRELLGAIPPADELLDLVIQARGHGFLGQLAMAEKYYARAVELQPSNALPWIIRGMFWAQQGQWERAQSDFGQAHLLQPGGEFWDDGYRSVVQLRLGDNAGYATTCLELRRRFRDAGEPRQAADLAWICSLYPETLRDRSSFGMLAERCSKEAAQSAWSALACGAALCRAGRYEQAAVHLRQALGLPWPDRVQPEAAAALTELFLSLTEERLGHADVASKLVKHATAVIDLGTANEAKGDLGTGWYIWAACQIVRHEVNSRIGN